MGGDMTRRSVAVLFCLIAAFAMVSAGCEATTQKRIAKKHTELSEELCDVASDFGRRLIWKDYDGAGLLMVPEKKVSFLEKAEYVASKLSIEDYKVALCQVSSIPFERADQDTDYASDPDVPPVMTPSGEVQIAKPEEEPELAEGEEKPKLKMPKVFYGVVLMRLINVSVMPSNRVQNKLIKLYWVWTNDVWMCDLDLEDLIE
jgi:hypothetical protein